MPGVAGSELKFALKKAAVWGTAVACGAGDGFLSRAPSLKKSAGVTVDDSLGLPHSIDGTPGAITVAGDLPLNLRYDGVSDIILAMVMGACATAQQETTTAYEHTLTWADAVDGIFATFAEHLKNYISEIPSLKITGFTLSGSSGQPISLTAHCIGNNKVPDSAVNTTAAFAAVTIGETANAVRFAQGVFRMNDQNGLALAAGDKIYPTSFELTIKRNLAGVYSGQYVTSGDSPQDLIDEPTANGKPDMTLKLTFPRHTSSTYLVDLGNDARKKMDIVFTGGNIEDTYNRSITLELPHLQLTNVDPVDEEGIIKEPLEFLVHGAPAAPLGMTSLVAPLRVTLVNTRTASPLA